MKTKLIDLNNHLFAQLERLSDEDLTVNDIDREVKRAAAIVDVADSIVDNARIQLQAVRLVADHGQHLQKHLPMMGGPAAQAPTMIDGRKA